MLNCSIKDFRKITVTFITAVRPVIKRCFEVAYFTSAAFPIAHTKPILFITSIRFPNTSREVPTQRSSREMHSSNFLQSISLSVDNPAHSDNCGV